VERSGSDIALSVANASIEFVDKCSVEKITAGRMMSTPERVQLDALASAGLVYVPLPEAGVLTFGQNLFDVWPAAFKKGVLLLEDRPRGEEDEADPEARFLGCYRLRFDDGWGLQNAGFLGRFLVWIDHPRVFMNFSFSEFSGLCCPPEGVQCVFGQSLGALIEQFAYYAERLVEEDDRSFYLGLADHYSKQWSLRATTGS
jgi:hypothetical protein